MPVGDDYQIGAHKFITIDGKWEPPREHKELWTRRGMDGVQTATSGKRGIPFTLRTYRDVRDLQGADDLISDYRKLVDEDPVPLILDGLNSANRVKNRFDVDVISVEIVTMQKTSLTISGGFDDDTSEAMLICDWQLIAIAV